MMGHGYRSRAVRRRAEAADLPHLDLRLPQRRRRQAPFRRRDGQASGRCRGAGLFALQRPEPGDPRGSARRLGRGGGRARFLVSGMSAIATLFLAMVKPGDTIVHSGPLYAATETLIGRILGKFGVKWLDFPAGATREEIDARADRGRDRQRRADLSRKPGEPDQRAGRRRGGRRQPRRDLRRGEKPPIAIDNTFLGPLWHPAAEARRGHRRLFADQICRRAQRSRRGRRARHEGAHQHDPRRCATRSARSATRTPPGCCCGRWRRSNCA